jgi:lipopolysaccharide transport system permease protein
MNPHQAPKASIRELFASFWRNRQLILQLAKREVISRYRGSFMGLAWSFFNPILMLTVYTFVFSVIFKSHWAGVEGSKASFAVILFAGLIVHGMFAECASRAPSLILQNTNYVKRVVFPLEVLPWVAMSSAVFHAFVSLIVLLIVQVFLNHTMPLTAVFFPVVLLPLLLVTMGVAWFLSAIGVYLRDIGQIIGLLTTVLMFLSPVLYPLSSLPLKYQFWARLNPLTYTLEEGRSALIFGNVPSWPGWGKHMIASVVIAWIGFWWFQRSRKGFADVL